jgi:SWI/SNF-related matrix-associated actin-dependent regulator 1 of chromatin subfamily A
VRVVAVKPRADNLFGVTLSTGASDGLFWLLTGDPPKLGELVEIKSPVFRKEKFSSGDKEFLVNVIEGGGLKIIPDEYSRRMVPVPWLERAQASMRRQLYPYQVEGAGWIASRLYENKGSILGDEMGVGKSGQAISAITATNNFPCIIVCPASLKHNWLNEWRFCKHDLQIHMIQGRHGALPRSHVFIVNYELMKSREQQLGLVGAKCILFDEAHRLKKSDAGPKHRASVATRLSRTIGRPIVLTGTPLLNRPEELWRLLHIVDPMEWPNYKVFKERYLRKPTDDEKNKVRSIVTNKTKLTRLDELQARIAPVMLRRLRSDVQPDIPAKTRRSVLIDLQPIDQYNYDQAEQDVVSWLRALGSQDRANAAVRNQALVKLTMLRKIAAIGKLRKAFPEYIHAWFDRTQKFPLVIFGYHVHVLLGVTRICQRMGIRASVLTGSDTSDERNRVVNEFQSGRTDAFIAPILSAGLGLNLHRASDVLFLERMWTPALMSQAEARVERIGQKNPVTATYLDAARTVDEYLAMVLMGKQAVIDRVVDDVSYKDDFASETVDEVLELLRQSSKPAQALSPLRRPSK